MKAYAPKVLKVALLVALADQMTKAVARVALPLCTQAGEASCTPVGVWPIRFLRMGNGGSALGFAQGEELWSLLALLGFALALYYLSRRPGTLLGVAAGLQLGGTVSNLSDRLAQGAVTDYFVTGPIVLNLADLALVAGMVIAVRVLLIDPREPKGRIREEVKSR
jgi:signal peptidase II